MSTNVGITGDAVLWGAPVSFTADGVIFGLDGVVLDVQAHVERAWRSTLDQLLASQGKPTATPDEVAAVAGDPDPHGALCGLAHARGLHLPAGRPGDQPSVETLCATVTLALAGIEHSMAAAGAEPNPLAVALADRLSLHGRQVAVVTRSAYAHHALVWTDAELVFDVVVDGEDATATQMSHVAQLRFAAAAIDAHPRRTIAVVACPGEVAAARSAGIGLVVGVDTTGDGQRLHDAGAHLVLSRLDGFTLQPDLPS